MKRKVKKDLSKKENKIKCHSPSSCGGCFYFLGFIGAVVYYIQNSTSFGSGVLGILKALVWPAILIYKLLGFLYSI
ncbi:MAG: hypothetical protein ABIH37_01675 [archaeon]